MEEKVSIIAAARNEEKTIRQSLESLLNQTYNNIEIIIVTDDSEDRTDEIAEEYAEKYPFIKHYVIEYKGRGCVIPRIEGIKRSTGEILFMVDADAYYSKDYIEKCIRHLKDPHVGGVIGKIRIWEPKTILSKYRDVQYRLRWDDEENMDREIREGKIAPWIFRQELYEKLGGYDERLAYGEDRDFGRRMLKADYKIIYEPSTEWYHRWEDYVLKSIGENYSRGKSNYEFTKNSRGDVVKVVYFLLPAPILILSLLNYIFFLLIPLHMLPMFIRGLRFFFKSNSPYRGYAFLSPLITYISNIPYSIGFSVSFLNNLWRKYR
jgi:glycosyltransferase involved in cell wall biosynthesis